ncbi:hypothetical protein [Thermoanaerobaculum aquaticum]|uniref:hypothetical protein n=1 Tax=Thermoanaerobaculum aquaticum TaxID=1312852 RepID=UPI000571DFF2|nr:hypothetical protein [Thermoanaerobaculum aquaticum]
MFNGSDGGGVLAIGGDPPGPEVRLLTNECQKVTGQKLQVLLAERRMEPLEVLEGMLAWLRSHPEMVVRDL